MRVDETPQLCLGSDLCFTLICCEKRNTVNVWQVCGHIINFKYVVLALCQGFSWVLSVGEPQPGTCAPRNRPAEPVLQSPPSGGVNAPSRGQLSQTLSRGDRCLLVAAPNFVLC